MRPVNLIPLEDRTGDQAPLRAGAASYVIVAVLALVLVGTVLVVLAGNKIKDSESQLAALEQRQLQAQQAASELAPYGEFASLSQSRDETVISLARSRFDWERVLSELALVIPEDVWLETLTGSATGSAAGDAGGSAASDAGATSSLTAPNLQITGCAAGQESVARLLAALKDIDGVTRVGMQRSELGASDDAAATGSSTGSTGSCQTRSFIASFEISISFDAVPASAFAVPVTAPEAVPAAATADATTEVPATDDDGVAAAEAEQQAATDSAAAQSAEAQSDAATVGVGTE